MVRTAMAAAIPNSKNRKAWRYPRKGSVVVAPPGPPPVTVKMNWFGEV
jgi:hypothetical protein